MGSTHSLRPVGSSGGFIFIPEVTREVVIMAFFVSFYYLMPYGPGRRLQNSATLVSKARVAERISAMQHQHPEATIMG
jgi:hypothetical protein